MAKMLAVMYATHRPPRMEIVLRLLEKAKIDYKIYNDGGPWFFGLKLVTALRAAREETTYSHIFLMDAFDVLVLASHDEILNRWKEFNHPWVCNAEVNCWPKASKGPMHPAVPTYWRYLNSGAYIAEREYLATILDAWKADQAERTYDQDWLMDEFLAHPESIMLDTDCKLFQTLCGCEWLLKMGPGQVHNKFTGTDPAVIHYNGGSDIEKIKYIWDSVL